MVADEGSGGKVSRGRGRLFFSPFLSLPPVSRPFFWLSLWLSTLYALPAVSRNGALGFSRSLARACRHETGHMSPPPQTVLRIQGRASSAEQIRRADLLGHALGGRAPYRVRVRFGGRARAGGVVVVVVVVVVFQCCSLPRWTTRQGPNQRKAGHGQAISASASFASPPRAQFTPTPARGHRAVCVRLPDRAVVCSRAA